MAAEDDGSPLLIKVTEFGWQAVSRTIPPTPRDEWLVSEIHLAGGIDLTVAPGLYLFNIMNTPAGEKNVLLPYKHKKKIF